jgi:transposase
MGNAGDGEASGAQSAPKAMRWAARGVGAGGRREAVSPPVCKTVPKQGPRRPRGPSPNSRLGRRNASPHWQERETTMSSVLNVGIDVAKKSCVYAFRPAECPVGEFDNTPAGIRSFLKILEPLKIHRIVLEATGGFDKPLAVELIQAGYSAFVVNPRQVRQFAESMNYPAKTDILDAEVLAHFAEVANLQFRPLPSPQTTTLAELVTRRRQLIDLMTQENNRLAMIHCPVVRKSIRKMIDLLTAQLRTIEACIHDHIQSDDNFRNSDQILQSTPGVGPQTSATLIAQVPELGRLNRHQIGALIGVAPRTRQSGNRTWPAHIVGGRKEVRSALYMAALTAMQWNPPIREFAQRLRHNGKPFKVVLTACMRKLLVILNTMIANQSFWNPEKCLKSC